MSRGFHRKSNGDVVLTMSPSDFDYLLMCLSMATGCAAKDEDNYAANSVLALANRLNAGNSKWHPYVVPPEVAESKL